MMNKNKKIIIISSLALLAVLVVAGLSYALFSERLTGETNYVINAGDLQVKLDESKNLGDILQENNIPISDAEGKDLDGYKFSLINNENKPLSYTIYIVEDTVTNKTPSNDIKMYYTRDYGNVSEMRLLSETNNSENKLLESGTIPANTTFNYDLKLWLDKNAGNEILGTTYSCHIEVVTTQVIEEYYVESILNGTEPVLTDNLVPVTIEDDGTVLKADLTKNWYSYENKEWANAIVLKDQTETYNVNQEIPEDKIESYFVWIPKYSYQLWDLGNYSSVTTTATNKEQEIKIRFGTTNTNNTNTNECVTPEATGETGKCIVGDYMTHPAFLAFEGATGFWTGKFETGFSETTAPTSTTGLSTDTSQIIIKPNVYSWRNNTTGNFFKLGYDYIREDESHMMKNTEWGAVTYLQHSKYGSMASVRINNNSNFITGYAATEEPTKGYNEETSITGNRVEGTSLGNDGTYTINYLNSESQVASTTGNYSGIYDMSGGAWDYVMGYTTGSSIGVGGSSKITSTYSDFFTNNEWNKYYDKYSTTTDTNFRNRILGDATGEMGPFFNSTQPNDVVIHTTSWHKDYINLISSTLPWFGRGGSWTYGTSSGVFASTAKAGDAGTYYGFRIVLTPTK